MEHADDDDLINFLSYLGDLTFKVTATITMPSPPPAVPVVDPQEEYGWTLPLDTLAVKHG